MNKLVILSFVVLLVGCSDGSAALRPGSARLGAEIAPTTGQIAPTTAPALEIAPTMDAKLHQQPKKLHQQHIWGEDKSHAIYGGRDADPPWIAVALLGVFFIVIWAIWIGRAVARRMEKQG